MVEQVGVAVIGAGQAGLAISYYLTQHGRDHVVLEKDRQVGSAWRHGRWDSFTLYPNDVVGRIWAVRVRPGVDKECYRVFSTTCPHLGCSVNCNPDQAADPGFTCPCHNGRFALDGSRLENNPATRGMYALEFDVAKDPTNPDENNRDLLLVKYVLTSNEAAPAKA